MCKSHSSQYYKAALPLGARGPLHRRLSPTPPPRTIGRSPCAQAVHVHEPSLCVWFHEPLSGEANGLEGLIRPLRVMLTAVWSSFSHATKPISAFSITQVSVMPCAKMPNRPMPPSDQRSPLMLGLTPDLMMARQYLGCPASSAAVERLFSQVGIAFSAKRKSAESDTLEDIMFSRIDLP